MGRELGVLQGAEDADGVSSGLSLGREQAEKSAGKAVGGGAEPAPGCLQFWVTEGTGLREKHP